MEQMKVEWEPVPWVQPDARHKMLKAMLDAALVKVAELEVELDTVRTEYQRVVVFLAQSNQLQNELREENDTLRAALPVPNKLEETAYMMWCMMDVEA